MEIKEKPIIWILGKANMHADRSIEWHEEIPILSDPDILIIPISTFSQETVESLNSSKLKSIQEKIFNKFISGGKIIFILERFLSLNPKYSNVNPNKPIAAELVYRDPPFSNYILSPIVFEFEEVSEINLKNYNERGEFSSYLNKIQSINRIIKAHFLNKDLIYIKPYNSIVKNIIKQINENNGSIEIGFCPLMWDRANNTLAEKYWLKLDGFWKSGDVVYLPPLKNKSIDESLELIFDIYNRR